LAASGNLTAKNRSLTTARTRFSCFGIEMYFLDNCVGWDKVILAQSAMVSRSRRPSCRIHNRTVIELSDAGLYCAAGGFHIDPWSPVERSVITHAHSDHARAGSQSYLTSRAGQALLRARIGDEGAIQGVEYGERIAMGEVTVSLHPAGHILGSAQIRIESRGEVWVVSGDYKLAPDATCTQFDPQRCHTFVTESTFALPIYRWDSVPETTIAIHDWWRANREAGRTSVLFAHPLGKAQRVLSMLDRSIGPVCAHGAVEKYSAIYRAQGIALPPMQEVVKGALVLAPPSAMGSPWLKRFGVISTAMASGWMRIRGARRRRSLDRGFALSDHADWAGLLRAIDETRAEAIWVTHGYRAPLARWLEERGRCVKTIDTRFEEGEE
jgi:putative mRNA 3-end processing factor